MQKSQFEEKLLLMGIPLVSSFYETNVNNSCLYMSTYHLKLLENPQLKQLVDHRVYDTCGLISP